MNNWNHGKLNCSLEDIVNILKNKKEIHIGTDSQPRGNNSLFVTAICFKDNNKIDYFWNKKLVKINGKDYNNRLPLEIYTSIEIALYISENISEPNISIHFDINSNPEFKSNVYYGMAKGMAEGCGFNYFVKPLSWAATSVADWHTK